MIGIRGPFSVEEIGEVAGECRVIYGKWYVNYTEIVLFIEGLGMHSRHTLQALDDVLHCKTMHSIGNLSIRIVEEIVNIQAERNYRNNADSDLPCVLPHELIKMSSG